MNNKSVIVFTVDNNLLYVHKCFNVIESFNVCNKYQADKIIVVPENWKYEDITKTLFPDVQILKITNEIIKTNNIQENKFSSVYYRLILFALPDIIKYDKVLFLDSDIDIYQDLTELFENTVPKDKSIGFVMSHHNTDTSLSDHTKYLKDSGCSVNNRKYVNYDLEIGYVCAGGFICDMKRFKSQIDLNNLTKDFIELFNSSITFKFKDQDIYNIVFNSKPYSNELFKMPLKFNYFKGILHNYNPSDEDIYSIHHYPTREKYNLFRHERSFLIYNSICGYKNKEKISIQDLLSHSFLIEKTKEQTQLFDKIFQKNNLYPLPKHIKLTTFGNTTTNFYKNIFKNIDGYPKKLLGISYSHISAINTAKTLDWPFVCIFEDTAYPCKNIKTFLNNNLSIIPEDCKCYAIGNSNVFKSTEYCQVNKIAPNVEAFIGSHAYIIFKEGYDEYLNIFNNECIPDNIIPLMSNGYYPEQNTFIQYLINNPDKNSKTGNYIWCGKTFENVQNEFPMIEDYI